MSSERMPDISKSVGSPLDQRKKAMNEALIAVAVDQMETQEEQLLQNGPQHALSNESSADSTEYYSAYEETQDDAWLTSMSAEQENQIFTGEKSDKCLELGNMQHSWEDMNECVKVTVVLPPMTNNVDVAFTQRSFTLQFRTLDSLFCDSQFADGNTTFLWTVNVCSDLDNGRCYWELAGEDGLSITLGKENHQLPCLELSSDEDSPTNSENDLPNVYLLSDLHCEIYDRGPNLEDLVVRIAVKMVQEFEVLFCTKGIAVKFQTRDRNFLSRYDQHSPETQFVWSINLFSEIVPDKCSYRFQGQMEIVLRKKRPTQKWLRLTEEEPKPARKRKPVSSVSADSPEALNRSITETTADEPSLADSSQQSSSSLPKPTCKVPPYDEKGMMVKPGFTGLRNIGNTCFMNATLQVLMNCRELKDYFINEYYRSEINRRNPLGFGGKLAVAFGDFVKDMWSGMNKTHDPSELKELVSKKATQFANFAQHDAQEFLSFLLDGLHEDLNRIKEKPYTETVESDGRADCQVAQESWKRYKSRNDSLIVDLFHGLLKSRLECPQCQKISITFDPFAYLSVPFPKNRRKMEVYFWPVDPYLEPTLIIVSVPLDGYVRDLFVSIGEMVNVPIHCLRMIEVYKRIVHRKFEDLNLSLSKIMDQDLLFIFQVHDEKEAREKVLELCVIQRLLQTNKPMRNFCESCENEPDDTVLSACTKCFNVLYCDRECQRNDWDIHQYICSYPDTEKVGFPFMISVPKSKATYTRLVQMMEARCKYSVNVFQPPVASDMSLDEPSTSQSSIHDSNSSDCDILSTTSDSSTQLQSTSSDTVIEPEPEKKIQLVLGEPRDKWRFNHNLFSLRNTDNRGIPDKDHGDIIKDKNPSQPLNLDGVEYMTLDWHNKQMNKEYLMIESKSCLEPVKRMSGSTTNENLALQDLLQLFTEKETLSKEEAWYCGKCKEHQQATKSLVLWQLPEILIVQLKRFVYTHHLYGRSKNEKHVAYPVTNLDMKQYLCPGAPEQETKYDLMGVVCHSGSSYFGHYVSFGRLTDYEAANTEIEWRSFDDSFVTKVPPQQAQNNNAYLLFYKKHGSQTKEVMEKYGELTAEDECSSISNDESTSKDTTTSSTVEEEFETPTYIS